MSFIHSTGFKYLKNLWIGVGAGFIILGALFKLMYWPYADEILIGAMIMEASIFFLQALLPPHKDYYWEKIYPGLDRYDSAAAAAGKKGPSLTQQLDKSLENNKVGTDLIDSLGSSLKNLGDNVGKLTGVVDSASATEDFSRSAKAAAEALNKVQSNYSSAANVAADLTAATEGTKNYHEQVQLISKNLAALNAVYELELQDTNNHLKAMNTFYGNLTSAISNLNESLDDTETYKNNMRDLSVNIKKLNQVYGNMLTAMNPNA